MPSSTPSMSRSRSGCNEDSCNVTARNKNADRLEFSLDILTDGSDYTGHGTVFLTASLSPLCQEEEEYTLGKVLARYALTGLATQTSRLAADQAYKLGPLRAILCPSYDATGGIPSLLLSSSQAGKEEIAIVGPAGMETYMNALVPVVLGVKKRMSVVTCEVPDTENDSGWWIVWDDELITVHARSAIISNTNNSIEKQHDATVHPQNTVPSNEEKDRGSILSESSKSVVYIITTVNKPCYSFAVLPPNVNPTSNMMLPLPQYILQDERTRNSPLQFMLHTNPNPLSVKGRLESENSSGTDRRHNSLYIWLDDAIVTLASHHLTTLPNHIHNHHWKWDSRILVRASYIARLLHESMPFAFPVRGKLSNDNEEEEADCFDSHRAQPGLCNNLVPCRKLHSCTSILLRNVDNSNTTSVELFQYKCRKSRIQSKFLENSNKDSIAFTPSCVDDSTVFGKGKEIGKSDEKLLLEETAQRLAAFYQTEMDDNSPTHRPRFPMVCADIWAQQQQHTTESQQQQHTTESQHDEDEIDLSEVDDEIRTGWKLEMERTLRNDNQKLPAIKNDQNQFDGDGLRGHEVLKSMDDNLISLSTKDLVAKSVCGSTTDTNEQVPARRALDVTTPHLLVLGTGCASPSPLRGSSGYALLLPTMTKQQLCGETRNSWKNTLALTAVIECGEGTVTAISRYLPSCSDGAVDITEGLRQIRLIWVSHAHLDHYGDLPDLIKAIYKARGRPDSCQCGTLLQERPLLFDNNGGQRHSFVPNQNGQRTGHSTECLFSLPPVVIAPSKVLRFLDISLQCKNGVYQSTEESAQVKRKRMHDGTFSQQQQDRLYIGVSNNDFQASPFAQYVRNIVFGIQLLQQHRSEDWAQTTVPEVYCPFAVVRNIPVDHCFDSYALLLGLDTVRCGNHLSQPPKHLFFMCYSGDTRPSLNLVRACQEETVHRGQHLSLLVHESTFDDDDRDEALRKRHSTVLEAVDIFRRVDADACLLTHFSQRYPQFPPGSNLYDGRVERVELASTNTEKRENICLAIDGMVVPLSKRGISALPLLNRAILQTLKRVYAVTNGN